MFKQSKAEKWIVGLDLSDSGTLVSYANIGDSNVETFSMVAGSEDYCIPTALCKRKDLNQWLFGREALRVAAEGGGYLADHLVSGAIRGESYTIEEETYPAESLLLLFVKRVLTLIGGVGITEKNAIFMITTDSLDRDGVAMFKELAESLHIRTGNLLCQTSEESFYNYMLYQPKDLWRSNVLLFEYKDSSMIVYRLSRNIHTIPMVAEVSRTEYPFPAYDPMPVGDSLRAEKMRRLDDTMLQISEKVFKEGGASAVYLVGENFSEEWMKRSLRFLCGARKVFLGSNLFSKGACLALMERREASEAGTENVFLGENKLKTNVGMRVLLRGRDTYYALLDAGISWYEAGYNCEIYLQDSDTYELSLTHVNGGESKVVPVVLEGLESGPARLAIRLYTESVNRLIVETEDLGFGEFREASRRVWRNVIELS